MSATLFMKGFGVSVRFSDCLALIWLILVTGQESALERGIALAQENRLEEAERAFDSIPASDPAHWKARYYSAVTKAQLKKFGAAREALFALVAHDPNHKDAHYLLGMVLEEFREHSQAESHFRRCTLLAPRESRGWLALSRVLEIQGREPEAVRALKEAEALAPGDPMVALQLGSRDYERARFREAIPRLVRAWQANTHDREAVSRLAASYAATRDGANLQAVLEGLSPEMLPEVHQEIGLALLRQGNESEGFGYLVRGAQARPSDWKIQRTLADALLAAGFFEDAQNAYRQCLALNADDGESALRLGRALYEDRKITEALEQYKRASNLSPTSIDAWFHLGIAHRALGQVSESKKAFERALQMQPKNAEILYNLGILSEQQDRQARAEALFLQALRAEPKHFGARYELGRIWIAQEKWDAGLKQMDAVLHQNPRHAQARYQRAMALMRLGKTGEAEQELARFQTLEKEEREKRKVIERKSLVPAPGRP